MGKQRQFYVFKFTSSRLKNSNYNIVLSLNQARENKELIGLFDNQVLRSIRDIKQNDNKDNDFSKILEDLFNKRNEYKTQKNTKENILKVLNFQSKIDEITFIPEYISVKIEKNKHYEHIKNNGFIVNGKKFIRLSCGAGQARVKTVIFCDEEISDELKNKLNNNRKIKPMSPCKFNAYFGLSTSATVKIPEKIKPRICVIPDCKKIRNTLVDFVIEKDDGDIIEERLEPIEYNLFDGSGLITPQYARILSNQLGIKHLPAQFGIRNAFIKGMISVFDIYEFADNVSKKYIIKDLWGKEVNIKNIDIVLTESQFKLWDSYDSWEDYIQKCKNNNLYFGISRYTPELDEEYCFTNYQSIQTLNLNDKDIKDLCKTTVDWIKNVIDGDIMYTLLFLLGNSCNAKDLNYLLSKSENKFIKALVYNNNLIHDDYIKRKIYYNIEKKIKDAHIGRLLVQGNYSTMVSDPYALAEHLFGLDIKGLLQDKQHYSNFWNNKKVKQVDAMRSPLTHISEHNILNLQDNEEVNKWYKYNYTGIIYNVWGDDVIRHADSDFDLDLVMTTNNPSILKGVYKNTLPITYKKNTAPKEDLTEENMFKADLNSFDSKIGLITNYSTDMYAMLPLLKKDSPEQNEILRRLKITRKEQGSQIDKAKGILVKDFPKEWITYQKINKDDTEEIKDKKEFENKILIEKHPYFFIYLYPKYKKIYNNYMTNADIYCKINFGLSLIDLQNKKNKNKVEKKYLKNLQKFNPINESDCTMNKLCKYIESVKFDLNKTISNSNNEEILNILINNSIPKNEKTFKEVLNIFKEFEKSNNEVYEYKLYHNYNEHEIKDKFNEEDFGLNDGFNELIKNKMNKACSNSSELVNYIAEICYKVYPNKKSFLWNIFYEEIVYNVYLNKQEKILIPYLDKDGEFEYLGKRFNKKEIEVKIIV